VLCPGISEDDMNRLNEMVSIEITDVHHSTHGTITSYTFPPPRTSGV
jgi:hypothetical protein